MENQYDAFRELIKKQGTVSQLSQKAYSDSSPSLASKQGAASFYSGENANYANYLRNNPSNEEVCSVLAEEVTQLTNQVQAKAQNDLEGIVRSAPEKLVKFAAKNVRVHADTKGKYGAIAKAHEAYRELKEIKQAYKVLETRKVAREKLLKAVDKVYNERFSDCERTKKLIKNMARFSDAFLMLDYNDLIKKAEENFEHKLEGNEAGYLNENVKKLEDKSNFIGYLVSGDKKHLIKSAQENDDDSGAESIEDEVQRDEIANMSPTQAREMMLRNYEQANGYSEGEFALSRNAMAQNPAGNILTGNAA